MTRSEHPSRYDGRAPASGAARARVEDALTDQTTDSDKLQRIQIGNLPGGATEVQLRALFVAHGPIALYERPLDARTGKAGALAYVEMAPADAAAAIKTLNGYQLGEQTLSVGASRPFAAWAPDSERGPRSPQPRRTVTAATSRGATEDAITRP